MPGVVEAFHARFVDHVYPMHTHDTWTLLILDSGGIKYDLDLHEHGSLGGTVTLLPPHVPHSGSSIRPEGFRKRVLYLDGSCLSEELIGRSVGPPGLRRRAAPRSDQPAARGHRRARPGVRGGEPAVADLTAAGRPPDRRAGRPDALPQARDPRLASALRELLDARLPEGVSLEQASRILHADPAYLVRSFSSHFGMSPHLYLTGRRVDLARHLLLEGMPASEVAQAAGFYDQSHLTRHFKRFLGTTPGRFASHPAGR